MLKRPKQHSTTYIGVPCDHLPHVSRRILVQLLVVAKDEDGNIDTAEYGQLVRLLKETSLSFQEGTIGETSSQRLLSRRGLKNDRRLTQNGFCHL